jgi:phenylalanyl-tRNA synthetase beta subunit
MLESTTTLASLASTSMSGHNSSINQESLQKPSLAKKSNFSNCENFENLEETLVKTKPKMSENTKKVRMMIIDNLLNFISGNLDRKLNQIENLVEKNNKNLKNA